MDPASVEQVGEEEVGLAHARAQIYALELRVAELEETRTNELRAASRRNAEAESRAAEAEGRAAAAQAREREVAERLAANAANVESLSRVRTELDQSNQTLKVQLTAAQRELEQALVLRQPLEREVAELRERRVSLERELDHARDQLRIMTFERDELSRQATAFDGIAVKARERALAAEAENQRSAATLQELEVWRGELERRLAETTSELGSARAAREADERELSRLRGALAESERRGGPADRIINGTDGPPGTSEMLAEQAAEIERLAAELASLRARGARGGGAL